MPMNDTKNDERNQMSLRPASPLEDRCSSPSVAEGRQRGSTPDQQMPCEGPDQQIPCEGPDQQMAWEGLRLAWEAVSTDVAASLEGHREA